jgi:hypothetical protein
MNVTGIVIGVITGMLVVSPAIQGWFEDRHDRG